MTEFLKMVLQLIPKSVKEWLKLKIRHAVGQDNLFPSPLTLTVKYIPNQYGKDSFFIPKLLDANPNICPQGLIIPPQKLWLGYGQTSKAYLHSGEIHVSKMLELIKASSFSFARGNRILDFGCAAGRMIRHLKHLSESCEIWGTDINAEHIYWCKRNLTPPFNFATTTTVPHLPFADSYFDLIYTGSVFTHIDDLAEAWLLELKRILSPQGRLYITIHDAHTIKLLDTTEKETNLAKEMRSNSLYRKVKDNFGMLVIGRDAQSQIFYDIDYFCKTLNSMFDILSVTEEAYGYQTAILLQKK